MYTEASKFSNTNAIIYKNIQYHLVDHFTLFNAKIDTILTLKTHIIEYACLCHVISSSTDLLLLRDVSCLIRRSKINFQTFHNCSG